MSCVCFHSILRWNVNGVIILSHFPAFFTCITLYIVHMYLLSNAWQFWPLPYFHFICALVQFTFVFSIINLSYVILLVFFLFWCVTLHNVSASLVICSNVDESHLSDLCFPFIIFFFFYFFFFFCCWFVTLFFFSFSHIKMYPNHFLRAFRSLDGVM